MPGESTSTIVLVHGAWHGAWCWERVLDGLAARRMPTVAIDLPGHGDDPGPMGDLHTDAERVHRELGGLAHPVVLVGHSYGGAVITEAGDHSAVGHLVFLCAMALDEGESCMAAAGDMPGAADISHEGRPDLGSGLIISDDGFIRLEPSLAEAALFNQCDADTTSWARSVARSPADGHPSASSGVRFVAEETLDLRRLHRRPDRPPRAATADGQAMRGRTLEWDSDHSPFLSHPDLVVDLLVELARSTSASVAVHRRRRPGESGVALVLSTG